MAKLHNQFFNDFLINQKESRKNKKKPFVDSY